MVLKDFIINRVFKIFVKKTCLTSLIFENVMVLRLAWSVFVWNQQVSCVIPLSETSLLVSHFVCNNWVVYLLYYLGMEREQTQAKSLYESGIEKKQ